MAPVFYDFDYVEKFMSLFFTLIYNNGKPGIPFLATNMEAD
jgi:hypothetical protein